MEDNSLQNYTDAIGSLGNTAGGILGALNGNKSSAPAPSAAPKSSTNWGVIAAIGGAVILVLVLVVSMGGRR